MRHRWSSFRPVHLALTLVLAVASAGGALGQGLIIEEPLLGSSYAGCFPSGASLAMEVEDGEGLIVHRLALFADERLIQDKTLDPSVGVELWLGEIALEDIGGQPLSPGEYTILAFTCSGVIESMLTVTGDVQSACDRTLAMLGGGPRLVLYLLLDEDAASADVQVRDGGRILVALEGNPTTGYEWTDTTGNLFPVLEPLPGTEYIAHVTSMPLAGSGGRFFFRYRAIAAGSQILGFAYARPWEPETPAETILFAIDVI